MSNIDAKVREAALNAIATLAGSIRGCFMKEGDGRLDLMQDLIAKYCPEKVEWSTWIVESEKYIRRDGREMLNWPGPYSEHISSQDLIKLNYSNSKLLTKRGRLK